MTSVDRASSRRIRWLAGVTSFAVLALCFAYVIATVLGSALNHNEQMYVAAARLWWDHQLYADYAYLQAPLLPMVNGVLFWLFGHDQLVLIARLHVAFWGLVVIGSISAIGRRLCGGDRWVGLSAALAIASHALFLKDAAESSNYMMPLALAVLSVLAYLVSFDVQRARAVAACALGSGVGFGLAVSCKSFYAIVAAGLFAIVWVRGGRARLFPWCSGFALGALPLLYYAVRAPENFYFGNLGYHVANTEYRRATGADMPMTLAGKLLYVGELWWDPLLIALTLYALAGLGYSRRWAPAGSRTRDSLIAAGVVFLLACLATLVPTPIFIHYFGLPFVCLTILAMAAASLRTGRWRRTFVLICAGATVIAPATRELPAAFARDSVPRSIERDAAKLRQLIGCTQHTYVATLSPILPLEAGCAIYPELASGPFAFRVADQHPSHAQERLRIVGAGRLDAFLDAHPPHAILVGFERTRDPAFEAYARARGYVESDTRIRRRGRVWRSASSVRERHAAIAE